VSADETDAPEVAPEILAPRVNPALVGHRAAEQRILRTWASGRVPHAWLIQGPPGIGKATLAYRFARFVLAGGAPGADSLAVAPEHPVFHRVAAGGHADLLTVRRSPDPKTKRMRTAIVVDDVRAIGPFLNLTPAEGGWRVVVVDSAHEMNPSAANALLKVLEEPPRRALLLLTSDSALLPTIRSRCQRLTLTPLPTAELEALLAEAVPALPAQARATLAQLARGSPGRALAMAAADGLAVYRALLAVMRDLPALDVVAAYALADKVGSEEQGFATAADLLLGICGRIVRAAADAPPPEALPDEDWVPALAAQAPAARWLALRDETARLLGRAERFHLDRRQALVAALGLLQGAAQAA
jgi:DNA polymerase-3 subunit delta'